MIGTNKKLVRFHLELSVDEMLAIMDGLYYKLWPNRLPESNVGDEIRLKTYKTLKELFEEVPWQDRYDC